MCTCVLVVYVYMRDREMCLCSVSVVQETKPLGVIPLIRGEVREGMYVCVAVPSEDQRVWLCGGALVWVHL